MATRTQILQQYIAAGDKGDYDVGDAFVTDDFLYNQGGAGQLSNYGFSESGIDKEGRKKFGAKIRETHFNFVVRQCP